MVKQFTHSNEVRALMIEHSIFSMMTGLIVEIVFMLFSMLLNGVKMNGYETYWLTGFPLINSCVCQ